MSLEFDTFARVVTDRLGHEPGHALLLDICRALNGRRVYVPRTPATHDDGPKSNGSGQGVHRCPPADCWVNRWK